MRNTFDSLQERSNLHREHNDCTVKMTALVLDTSYEDAWNITKSWGRKARKGMRTAIDILPKMREMGLRITEVRTSAKTVTSFEKLGRLGSYIIMTNSHVLFHRNGKTYDWTEGRRHRIVSIFLVDGTLDDGHIDTECNTLDHDYHSRVELCKPVRKRKSAGITWKLVRMDTGATVASYKRKPTAKIAGILRGSLRLVSDPSVDLEIQQIKQFGGKESIVFKANYNGEEIMAEAYKASQKDKLRAMFN